MEIKKDILWRVYIVYVLVLVFALLIIGKVLYIQIFEGSELKKKATELTIDTLKVDAIRGDIYADDGNLLATSVPVFEIRIDFMSINKDFFNDNVDSLSLCFSNLFKDKSKNEYKQMLLKAKKDNERYFLLKRGVNYTQLKELRKFPIFKAGRYKGGKIEIQKYRREMPYKTLAARTIGFEREGIFVGIEGAYSKKLEGKSGLSLKQKIAGGVWMPINDDNEVEPQNGDNIITTINVNMQDAVENALIKNLTFHNANHGCALLMEVETGEIKAIANLTKTKDGSYEEKYNYAIGESSEPGSTFKLASIMAAMEDNLVALDDTVQTGNGVYRYFNQDMIDAHEGGYGRISVKKAFEVSSNVGISRTIYKCYAKNPQKFIDRLYSMKLNEPLGLDIDGEGMPVIKNTKSKSWSRVSLPWMSVGYELSLTPLQILAFYNAVANDGRLMKPMFVKEVRRFGKVTELYRPVVIKDAICSKPTIDKAHKLLEGVVENGTAKNIKNSLYTIAGKTGTAQIARGKFGYENEKGFAYKASFVGYFPADKPKYSCIVVVNNPANGVYYGGSVAAPVFKEIADRVYAMQLNMHQQVKDTVVNIKTPYVKAGSSADINIIYNALNIRSVFCDPKYSWASVVKNKNNIGYVERKMEYAVIPDVIGMTAKDAMFILENNGMKVKIIGRGVVVRQSENPGSKRERGKEIVLELTYKTDVDTAYVASKHDTMKETDKLKEQQKDQKSNDKIKDKQKNKQKERQQTVQQNKDATNSNENKNPIKDKDKIKSNKKSNNHN